MLLINPKYRGLLRNYRPQPNSFFHKKYQQKLDLLKKQALQLVGRRRSGLMRVLTPKKRLAKFPKFMLEKSKSKTFKYLPFKKSVKIKKINLRNKFKNARRKINSKGSLKNVKRKIKKLILGKKLLKRR